MEDVFLLTRNVIRARVEAFDSNDSIYWMFCSDFLFQLELQFEDRNMQFTVTPVHAAIIMQFQEQTR